MRAAMYEINMASVRINREDFTLYNYILNSINSWEYIYIYIHTIHIIQ